MSREAVPRLSVIVPVFNEAATIGEVVARLQRLPVALEILIVDDGSDDGTAERIAALQAANVRCFRHPRNRGKGRAIRTALAHAQGEIVMVQDADLECDPVEIPRLLAPILEGRAEVVYGSRFLAGGARRRGAFYWGNRCLTWITNVLTGYRLTDMETAYKVFKAPVLRALRLRSDRFGFEPEVTMKIAKRRHTVVEVPIAYHPRGRAQGKKLRWRDGLTTLWCLFKYRCVD